MPRPVAPALVAFRTAVLPVRTSLAAAALCATALAVPTTLAAAAAFMHEFQVLAGAGYLVLYPNPRGNTTYGQAFGNVIQHRYPGDDYLDLMAGVDEVVKRGYVAPERMAVCGGSGGGLLTNWTITHTERFAVAVTDRCVSEWISFYHSTDFTLFRPTWGEA